MKREHGTPQTNPDGYEELTPFNVADRGPGNEQFLDKTVVRVYHDVDVDWYLRERRRSVFDENYANGSELIKRLLLQGNLNAQFIQSEQKGYRSNGTRHPHSWSILNGVECIRWHRPSPR